MATRQLPDAELLRKLLRYDPETGKLYWRERTPDMFCAPKTCNPVAFCAHWNSLNANRETFTNCVNGYMMGSIKLPEAKALKLKAHRVIWCLTYGYWPDQIDHINQDRADNRLKNLRLTDAEANGRNCRLSVRNRSGRIGVHWSERHGKWRAKIRANGRQIYLGNFDQFEDACKARALAEARYNYSKLHGNPRT